MPASSLFESSRGSFMPTELALGPWDRSSLHGGAVAALLASRHTRCDVPGRMTRFAVELLRPVPSSPLTVDVDVTRAGRQVQRAQARLLAGEQVVALSTALHLTPSEEPLPGLDPAHSVRSSDVMPAPPESGVAPDDIGVGRRVTFARNAVEIRVVEGAFTELGPSALWFRLVCPVLDDEPPDPWARTLTAADFCNGASAVVPWGKFAFANADLVAATFRETSGEWVAINPVTQSGADGVAVAHSQLWDQDGMLGTASQTVAVRAIRRA